MIQAGEDLQYDRESRQLLELLEQAGYRAYMVGGCVRDACMGRAFNDVDLTTSALPEQTEAVLAAAGVRFIETGLQHGTVTAVLNGKTYEITTFRTDGSYSDSRHPDGVTFVPDVETDLARRDFTVNAMAYHPLQGLVDPFGGQLDLQRKCLRCVGNPTQRFTEDALRILRALRFASVLGFTLEPETAKAAFALKDRLQYVSAERVYTELCKLLLGDWAFDVLVEYKEIIGVILPELIPTFTCSQHTKWHIYDVFTHIAKSVESSPKDADIRLVMLFHDVGKPACKTTDETGNDHFYGHPAVSEQLALAALQRLKASRASIQRILPLICFHDGHIRTEEKSVKRWLRRLGAAGTLDLIDVKTADLAAQNLKYTQPEIEELYRTKRLLRDVLERGDAFCLQDLDIGGRDLLERGYQGKAIGAALDALLDAVISGEAENSNGALLAHLEQLNLPKTE